MLVNVLDLRERPYRWKRVLAVVQSATKDNEAEDCDKVEHAGGIEIDYAERDGVTVREAFAWADGIGGKVTLYLYDREEGESDDPASGREGEAERG